MKPSYLLCLSLLFFPSVGLAHLGLDQEIHRLTRLLKRHPQRVSLLFRRAQLLIEHHEFRRARMDLSRLLYQRANDARVKLLWIKLAHKQRRWKAMRAWLKRYERCHKRGWRFWRWSALLAEKTGKLAQAIEAYSAMFQTRVQPDAVLTRGRLQIRLQRWSDARRGYQEALRTIRSVVVVEALVKLEIRLRKWTAVTLRLQRILRTAPVKIRWRLLLADIQQQQKKPKQARRQRLLALKEAEELVSLRPSVLNRLQRLWVWRALGQRNKRRRECASLLQVSSLPALKRVCKP